ncbi:hypothetical protein [Flavobacterium longum]|uniref:hypothetical protein n=1 Tax=Flavobacterium longum TaxID=1299340 RepID=UPI0039EC8C81
METATHMLTRFAAMPAKIWQRLQWRNRFIVQRNAQHCYAVFMSRELSHGRNTKPQR